MTTTARPRPKDRRRCPSVLTFDQIRDLLKDDFARECRAVFGYAVHAEWLAAAGRTRPAARVEQRGQLEVSHALALCQLIYDFGGSTAGAVDELNAVLNADRVAGAGWAAESVRRLRDRARQLRAVGEPGLAKRLARLAAVKRASPDLCELLAE